MVRVALFQEDTVLSVFRKDLVNMRFKCSWCEVEIIDGNKYWKLQSQLKVISLGSATCHLRIKKLPFIIFTWLFFYLGFSFFLIYFNKLVLWHEIEPNLPYL